LENVVQVNLDGAFSDVEHARYFLVGHSLNQQCYDLPLPCGQAFVLLIAHDFRLYLAITAQKQLLKLFFLMIAVGISA
jgi:hypothetical protein